MLRTTRRVSNFLSAIVLIAISFAFPHSGPRSCSWLFTSADVMPTSSVTPVGKAFTLPPYEPAAQTSQTVLFRGDSRGALAEQYPFQYGVARIFKDGVRVYERTGGAGGGRGINIAAIDVRTAELIHPVLNFDTWESRTSGEAANAMVSFLNSIPAGTLLLIVVCDEAGLNQFDSCTPLGFPWAENLIRSLESLGSRQIRTSAIDTRGRWLQ